MTIFSLLPAPLPFPALSQETAVAGSSLLTLAYVGGLYVSTATRIGQAKSKEGVYLTKDDAVVVKSRLKAASATTLVSLGIAAEVIRRTAFARRSPLFGFLGSLRVLGVSLPCPSFLHGNVFPFHPSLTLYSLHHIMPSIICPLALTATLFAGPLYVSALDGTLPGQRNSQTIMSRINNIWGVRNYIVGPLTEEIVFRGCILALHALSGTRRNLLILATPAYFAIAHLHHAYEGYVAAGRTREAAKRSLLTSATQFAYTTVFAWYANYLFVQTNSLLAPLVAHIFCNLMGLPTPFAAEQEYPRKRWHIRIAHIAGVIGFVAAIKPFTKAGLFGGSWYASLA